MELNGWPPWADTEAKRARNVAYWQAHNARIAAERGRRRWHRRTLVIRLTGPWWGKPC